MSLREFHKLVRTGGFAKADKEWFPKWLTRYAEFVRHDGASVMPLTRELAKEFSRELLANQVPAWQRQQAVRTLAAYRDLVLEATEPKLSDMVRILGVLAAQEREFGAAGAPDTRDQRRLIGTIDANESVVIQQMRRVLRVQGKALETERAYVGWVERFLRYCGIADKPPARIETGEREESPALDNGDSERQELISSTPDPKSEARLDADQLQRVSMMLSGVGDAEIRSFLTKLAVEGEVAPNTQRQAKSALLFLFQKVLSREIGFLDVVPADKPERLPVVLSRQEIAALLPEFQALWFEPARARRTGSRFCRTVVGRNCWSRWNGFVGCTSETSTRVGEPCTCRTHSSENISTKIATLAGSECCRHRSCRRIPAAGNLVDTTSARTFLQSSFRERRTGREL